MNAERREVKFRSTGGLQTYRHVLKELVGVYYIELGRTEGSVELVHVGDFEGHICQAFLSREIPALLQHLLSCLRLDTDYAAFGVHEFGEGNGD